MKKNLNKKTTIKKVRLVAMTGGGSGGHITPALAVARELKQLQPRVEVMYIGQTNDSLDDIPRADPNIDRVYTVRAGKFRRYHGEGWCQLLDVPTIAKNIRDVFFVLIGIVQSYQLLRKTRPAVIFTRGSFVSVPVALAAVWLKIPYITHDSDAIPSLANRLIARWATVHAVALPKEIYPYPASKTVTVGVPIAHHYRERSVAEQRQIKQRLGILPDQRVLLMTGGGLGAQKLNNALVAVATDVLERYPNLVIVHLTGRALADEVSNKYNGILSADNRSRLIVHGFVANLYDYSAVADLVISRAGGTSIAEFAAQAKACIVVPNPLLTGGHQTKNAQVLADRQAIELVSETTLQADNRALLPPIVRLLDDPIQAAALGARLQAIAQPDAAHRLGVLLLEQV